MFIDLFAAKTKKFFKLNVYMFSYAFLLFYDMTSLLLILLSFLHWNLHKQYISNQNIYRIKRFIILESKFTGNLELFWIKKRFLHWIPWAVFYVVILWVNGRKYENLFQFNTDCLAPQRTCYFLDLVLASVVSGYDLILLKKSHTSNCYSFWQTSL